MPIDPLLEPLLQDMGGLPEVVDDYPAFRRANSEESALWAGQLVEGPREVRSVEDITIAAPDGDLRLKVYRPFGDGLRPVHLLFHGGAFIFGSIDDLPWDYQARDRAALAEHVVVAVEYRKSPEFTFPVPLNDCYAALQWVARHAEDIGGRADAITVGGGSSGANLAAALCLKARDENGPEIALQILEMPPLDLTLQSPSHQLYGAGYALSTSDVEIARRTYVTGEADYLDPYVSPLLAEDLTGLPPALVLSAEYDVLADDGARYVERLTAAGVPARFVLQPGQVHLSFIMTKLLPAAREWRDDVIAALRAVDHA